MSKADGLKRIVGVQKYMPTIDKIGIPNVISVQPAADEASSNWSSYERQQIAVTFENKAS